MTTTVAQTQPQNNAPLVFGGNGGSATAAPPGGVAGAQQGAAGAAGAAQQGPAAQPAAGQAPMPFGAPTAGGQGATMPGAAGGPPVARLPHGIRGAVPYVPWTTLVVLAVLLLAAAAGTVFALRWWRRRKASRPQTPVDPWDSLKSRVAALSPTGAFGPKEREEYFFQLSLLLREGIELRTKLRATDLTWQELREPLRRKLPLPPPETEAILAFLERADLVKFAGAPADLTEAATAKDRCRVWLDRLTPRSIDQDATPVHEADASSTRKEASHASR